MAKRTINKSIMLSEKEAELLHKKAARSGMSEGAFVRYLICGINPIEALPDSFHEDMKSLSRIDRNINQITKIASSNGYVGEAEIKFLKEMKKSIDECYEKIIEKIMAPRCFKTPCCESVIEIVDFEDRMEPKE